MGRFTREDSYRGELDDPQSQNVYIYVMNNPLRYTDPTGHISSDVFNYDNIFEGIWNEEVVKPVKAAFDKVTSFIPSSAETKASKTKGTKGNNTQVETLQTLLKDEGISLNGYKLNSKLPENLDKVNVVAVESMEITRKKAILLEGKFVHAQTQILKESKNNPLTITINKNNLQISYSEYGIKLSNNIGGRFLNPEMSFKISHDKNNGIVENNGINLSNLGYFNGVSTRNGNYVVLDSFTIGMRNDRILEAVSIYGGYRVGKFINNSIPGYYQSPGMGIVY
nr:hypothetical protein [Orenia marismortui]